MYLPNTKGAGMTAMLLLSTVGLTAVVRPACIALLVL